MLHAKQGVVASELVWVSIDKAPHSNGVCYPGRADRHEATVRAFGCENMLDQSQD
jgi:hypothetical protein